MEMNALKIHALVKIPPSERSYKNQKLLQHGFEARERILLRSHKILFFWGPHVEALGLILKNSRLDSCFTDLVFLLSVHCGLQYS